MRSICVYCGSSPGRNEAYATASLELADAFVAHDISLVYGGAHIGLMGAIADRVLAGGGRVVGVIPEALVDIEIAHDGLTELQVVPDMHVRKARMAELSDGFIALPGGLGTLEELFEALTWSQLGLHQKPIGVLDASGYYQGLLKFLDHSVAEGFIKPPHRDLLLSSYSATDLLDQLIAYIPQQITKLDV